MRTRWTYGIAIIVASAVAVAGIVATPWSSAMADQQDATREQQGGDADPDDPDLGTAAEEPATDPAPQPRQNRSGSAPASGLPGPFGAKPIPPIAPALPNPEALPGSIPRSEEEILDAATNALDKALGRNPASAPVPRL